MEHAKLAVRALNITLFKGQGVGDRRQTWLKLSFGHQKFKTKDGSLPFQQPVTFSLSFHAVLFFFLQIDVYCSDDEGCWKPTRRHLGRSQLRAVNTNHSTTGWYDLRDKQSCFLPLDSLRTCLNGASCGKVVGSIQLELIWTFNPTATLLTNHQRKEDSIIRPPTPTSMSSASDGQSSSADESVYKVYSTLDTYKAYLFKKAVGLLLRGDNEDALMVIQALASGYNQGIELDAPTVLRSLQILQVYYKQRSYLSLELLAFEEITASSKVLLLSRQLFKFAMATLGWIGPVSTESSCRLSLDAMATSMVDYLDLDDESDVLRSKTQAKGVCKPSYLVAYSSKLDAVVIAIRCSMDANDFITDLVCEYVQWKQKDGFVHLGILKSAQWLFDECIELVEDTLRSRQAANVYITGHSLGAGVAVALCVMLSDRLSKETCNVHCHAFAPPPVFSSSIAEAYSEQIDCFVFKEDCVPRLSFGAMVDLQVMLAYCSQITWDGSSPLIQDHLSDSLLNELDACRLALIKSSVKPIHSGRLYFMCTVNQESRIFRVPNDYFSNIRLSSRMIQDHFPYNYSRCMEDVLNKHID